MIDDPFAAVDPSVARKIANSVKNFLANKTRVVVTHQSEYLHGADRFYRIDNQGVELISPVIDECAQIDTKESVVDMKQLEKDIKCSNKKPNEKVIHGKMGWKIYREYLSLALPFIFFIGYVIFEFSALALTYFSDILLKFWITDVEAYVENCQSGNDSVCDPTIPLLEVESSRKWKSWFILINCMIPLACACARVSLFRLLTVSNMALHSKMISNIMAVPMKFFEQTSPGVIMNRFSKDIGQVDDMLPICFSDAINILLQCLIILGKFQFVHFYPFS